MTETVTPRPLNYPALKAEILTAPYAGMTDVQILAAVNAKTVAAPKKALLSPSAVLNAIVAADLAALTPAQVSQLTLLLQGSTVDASANTTIRAAALAMFAGKAQTLSNLGALVAPFDNATASWALSVIGATPLVQADLDVARAS